MKLAILDRIGLRHMEGEDSVEMLKNWAPQEGALEAIAQLNHGGWTVVLANNQPGLGRGSVDVNALNKAHLLLHRALAAAGARLDAVFFCPHSPDDACACRAPQAGLLEQIVMRYGIQPHEIWVIAQELKYLRAGKSIGANLVQLCAQGHSFDTAPLSAPVAQFDSWSALASALTAEGESTRPANGVASVATGIPR